MTTSITSLTGDNPERTERLRVECVLDKKGGLRLTVEVKQAALEQSVLRHDTNIQPALIGRLVEELVGALFRVAEQEAPPQPVGPGATDLEDEAAFEADLDYVLEKNAELYKRLAQ